MCKCQNCCNPRFGTKKYKEKIEKLGGSKVYDEECEDIGCKCPTKYELEGKEN